MGISRNGSAKLWRRFSKQNRYYHEDLQKLAKNIIPADASVIEFGCKEGELLAKLPNKIRVGVDEGSLIKFAKKRYKKVKFYSLQEAFGKLKGKKFDYIYLSDFFSTATDIQSFIKGLNSISHQSTRVVIVYFNYLWKPLIDAGVKAGLVYPPKIEPNWLSSDDLDNFFFLESYERIKFGQRFLFPLSIPYLTNIINTFLSPLPLFRSFCLTNFSIYRPKQKKKEYSVSVVIPARNEEGNIRGILKKIPVLGKKTEVIFVEGHSKDDTYEAIKKEISSYRGKVKAKLFKQRGEGKGSAIREGFAKANNDLLVIFDADLTVDPRDLSKFYKAASLGMGELIMGTRLVYPMQKLAMRTLNILGNKFFSVAFSFLLDQKVRDTLCGTKVILKSNYLAIEKNRTLFGNFDPFGDFDLIFGSAKLNLKILEVPIRYKQRIYGKTNISRFTHGLLLLKMVLFAAENIKFV